MILFLVGDSRSLAVLHINFSLQKSTEESSMFLKSATLIHRTGAENQYRSSRSTCNMSCYRFLADNQSCRAEVPHKSYSPCHHPCLLLKLGPKPENFIVFHRFWNLGCPGLWGDAVWCDGFGPIVWSCLHLGIFTLHDLCHPLSTYSLPLTHGLNWAHYASLAVLVLKTRCALFSVKLQHFGDRSSHRWLQMWTASFSCRSAQKVTGLKQEAQVSREIVTFCLRTVAKHAK